MSTAPAFVQIHQNILNIKKKILVIGGYQREYPLEVLKSPRFIFWFAENYSRRETMRIPNEVEHIIMHGSTPRVLILRIDKIRPESVPLLKFPSELGKIGDYLLKVAKNEALNGEFPFKENSAKPLDATNAQKDCGSDVIAPRKRTIARKGAITSFIVKHANFSPNEVGKEIERLLELAKSQGITTTLSSLYQTFRKVRLKNESEKSPKMPAEAIPQEPQMIEAPLPITIAIKSEEPKAIINEKPLVIPIEARINESEDWYDPNISVWISFYPNKPLSECEKTDTATTGTGDAEEGIFPKKSHRKYFGLISSFAKQKTVLPSSKIIDSVIELEYKRTGDYPVDIPCFLEGRSTVWLAYSFDHLRYRKERPVSPSLFKRYEERLGFLESQYAQFQSFMAKAKDIIQVQDMLVVFDFQNFDASRRQFNLQIHPSTIVDRASRYMTQNPRRIVRSIIVDFDHAHHRKWKTMQSFEFYAVPEKIRTVPNPSGIGTTDIAINPTDQVIYLATYEAIEKFKLETGSLVVLVTGDHHFVPLLRDLGQLGFETMIIGHADATSEAMTVKPNYYLDLAHIMGALSKRL